MYTFNYWKDPEYSEFHLVKIGDNTFVLEECKNLSEGLSKREHLLENEGMLFNFSKKSQRSFHMKDCIIPLDIIFIEEGIVKKIFHNCPPCQDNECQKYEYHSTDTVVELLGGTCKKNNITEGLRYQIL